MEGTGKYTYNDTDAEYVVKIKGRKPWWLLLLLLLLPLILLLPFEKDVTFKAINKKTEETIPQINVNFKYVQHKFFTLSPFSFFTADTIPLENETDEKGEALFTKVKYTLFQSLFYGNEATLVTAMGGCLIGDTITPAFKPLNSFFPEKIYIGFKGFDLNFKIVDEEDNEPIPDASVKAIITGKENREDNQTSDPGGYATFDGIPVCGNIEVIANKEGYKPDTLKGDVESLLKGEFGRTLKLKPEKGMIEFVVKDLKSKLTIPGAKAILHTTNGNTLEMTTNTNGVGKGCFDSISLNKNFKIEVTKIYYYDTATAEYQVMKFLKFNEEQRTIYMRQKTENLVFRDIDAETGKIIVGAKNIISINGKTVATEYSNNQGCFTVSNAKPEDKITIIASKAGYVQNDFTIVNKKTSSLDNQAKRDIPLNAIKEMHTKPRKNCGVHFSGTLLSDTEIKGHISKIYEPDKYGEYVGDGNYPSNAAAFPNAVKYTFDAIAVDKGTHLTIYSKPNYQGKVLLDVKGPALINNVKWKNESRIKDVCDKTFRGEFEANFPKNCRQWSSENMNTWDFGSSKITCDE
ncbi:MAG: carboxypeptidase-like regulatory domain-containing protein [Bacteroidales bacterium]|nr:carboxypeptidase-like regulatory domain-containing protein [Bacteroidales bacterium]